MKKFFILILFCLFFFLSLFQKSVSAQISIDCSNNNANWFCDNNNQIELNTFRTKYIGSGDFSVFSIIAGLAIVAFVVLFIVLLVYVALAVLKFITSQGNNDMIKSATKRLKNAIIGFVANLLVIMLASLIVNALGYGSALELVKNLRTCKNLTLYEYRRSSPVDAINKGFWDCKCSNTGWVCSP